MGRGAAGVQVCAGFNPYKTIPVIIDAGCTDASGNSAKLTIRDHDLYTGRWDAVLGVGGCRCNGTQIGWWRQDSNRIGWSMKESQVRAVQGLLVSGGGTSGSWVTLWIWCIPLGHHSSANLRCHPGALVNTAYYGACSLIEEFMTAATELFSEKCLLQFEDNENNRCGKYGKTRLFEATGGCLLAAGTFNSYGALGQLGPSSLKLLLDVSWRSVGHGVMPPGLQHQRCLPFIGGWEMRLQEIHQ